MKRILFAALLILALSACAPASQPSIDEPIPKNLTRPQETDQL